MVRALIGFLCDRIGPRRAYTWLLVLGSLPVMGVGLAHDYQTFLLFRLAIGAIGASFVITQYHTSVMFAPNIVGTANAASAGWGNLGGGVTQMVMPLLFAAFLSLGASKWWGWRMAMFVPGVVMLAHRDRLLPADAGHRRRRLQGASCAWRNDRSFRGEWSFRGGVPRSARMGAVRHLCRMLRHGTDHRQHCRALLHR